MKIFSITTSLPAGIISFLYLFITAPCFSQSEHPFVRIEESTKISLVENPAIYFDGNEMTIPVNAAFTPIENKISQSLDKINDSPNWLRVILKNDSDKVQQLVVRYYQLPAEMHLLYKNLNNEWVRKKAGVIVKSSDKMSASFLGSRLEIKPGTDTIYFYNADTWRKFHYAFIDLVKEETILADKSDFELPSDTLTYALFAFIMLLLFQIFYVIIQAFYHRKIEYREYIFYLTTLIIYFTIRYELSFNISIITFGEPEMRRFLNDLMLFLPFAFYLRFSRHFIGIPQKFPGMNRVINRVETLIFICVALLILMFLTPWIIYETMFVQVLIIALSLYSLRLIIFFIQQRDRQIWFILAGSLAATIGHVCGMFLSWVPQVRDFINIEPIYFTMTGLSFEIFFFNTGLGFKAKSEQEEKVVTQEKLIEQLNTNRKMQLKMESMRNKIASDLHDDVGSTLSSIGLYSEVGIDQIEKNTPYVKGILEKISVSSQRMMAAMNDIVWAIHSRHEEGEGLVERIRFYADERLSPAGIKFKLEINAEAERLRLSMEARRNILLIFKEAINNAAKYSGSDSIDCSISISGNSFVCSIKDHGKGIDESIKHGGNGLLTMENRAVEMKGVFSIIPSKNHGTTVLITLPVNEIVLNGIYDNFQPDKM